MTDFHERLVKKKFDFEDLLFSIIISLLAILIFICIEWFVNTGDYWFLIGFLLIVGVVFLIRRRMIEWEYSVYASEMHVSKIYSKSTRKNICNIYFESCIQFGHVSTFEKRGYRDIKKRYICVCSTSSAENVYYIIYNINNSKYVLFFEPDENMLKYLKVKLSRIMVA